jgi:ABC-type nitrate/sulfonate/bicarbonate transport system ATPase subunit
MLTVPGIALRAAPTSETSVLCPSGCGKTVLRLRSQERIAPSSRSTLLGERARQEEGECPKCGAPFRLAVGER